jgi:hypothetical protein
MLLGMAMGSILISERGDQYFGEPKRLVDCNKFRYCEFFVMNRIIYCAGNHDRPLKGAHLLRDLQDAIAGTTKPKWRQFGFVNHDVQDIYAIALANIQEQNAIDNLYPDGFSARQFAAVIEEGLIWEILN